MYQPAAFVQADPDALAKLIAEQPLATLVYTGAEGQLVADPIPLQWRPAADAAPDASLIGHLVGHVARANPLWREADGTAVMAVFQGAQAYVSPAWYPSKAAGGQVVPTWNYTMVQAHGRLRAIDDSVWLRALVESLTRQHEGHRAEPWHVSDAPDDYIGKMLRAIVGIEIAVHRLDGKWKHSQNRSAADREGVAQGLTADAEGAAMAALVRPT